MLPSKLFIDEIIELIGVDKITIKYREVLSDHIGRYFYMKKDGTPIIEEMCIRDRKKVKKLF